MNRPLALAALLMAMTAAIHLFSGGADVHRPLLAAAHSSEMRLYVSLLWHFVTLFLCFSALVFFLAAKNPLRWGGMAAAAALLTLGMAGLFLLFGMMHLSEPFTAPQWALLAPIAGLALWPLRHGA